MEIWTHHSRGKTVVSPQLYHQATTPQLDPVVFVAIHSCVRSLMEINGWNEGKLWINNQFIPVKLFNIYFVDEMNKYFFVGLLTLRGQMNKYCNKFVQCQLRGHSRITSLKLGPFSDSLPHLSHIFTPLLGGCWKKVGSHGELIGTFVWAWRVSIYITLWHVHVPLEQNRLRYVNA